MNLSYLKYAVEVEKTGSITKAAQNFYMNQPHLSKIIRELERDLGCDIFDRTSRGMVPTKKGEEFLRYAKAILVQEEQIEALCVKNSEKALEVNLCVPRATYISYAFSDFLKHMDSCPSVNVHYMETNSRDTIRGVSGKTFDVGIIRCQALYESYYMKLLQDGTVAIFLQCPYVSQPSPCLQGQADLPGFYRLHRNRPGRHPESFLYL